MTTSDASPAARATMLQIGPLPPGWAEQIGARWPLHAIPNEAALATLPEGVRAGISVVLAAARLGTATPAGLPNLRYVLNIGVGYDQLDLAALKSAGVATGNLAGLGEMCVADMAMALLLDVARGTTRGDRFVRDGQWGKTPFPATFRISRKRLGIIGLGIIGHAIARRAAGFEMSIAYHNRNRRSDVPYAYAASALELARMSDHLVIASPGGAETRHMVDAEVLEALPAHGIVVNIGRGSVIDQDALMDALESGRLYGAGLDVLDGEPAVPPRLLTLDNVVLTPHRAGSTHEGFAESIVHLLHTLELWVSDGRVLAPI
jgi:hydroxypyruvate reductase